MKKFEGEKEMAFIVKNTDDEEIGVIYASCTFDEAQRIVENAKQENNTVVAKLMNEYDCIMDVSDAESKIEARME